MNDYRLSHGLSQLISVKRFNFRLWYTITISSKHRNPARINHPVDPKTILPVGRKSIFRWFTIPLPLSIIKADLEKGVCHGAKQRSDHGRGIA